MSVNFERNLEETGFLRSELPGTINLKTEVRRGK